jgi:hypothetical protein
MVISVRRTGIVFFLNVLSLVKKRPEFYALLLSFTGMVSGKTFKK